MPGWQISTKWSLACFTAECSPSVIPHWIRWVYTGIRQGMAVSRARQTRKVLVGLGIKDLVNFWMPSAVRWRDRNKEVSFSFWTREAKLLGIWLWHEGPQFTTWCFSSTFLRTRDPKCPVPGWQIDFPLRSAVSSVVNGFWAYRVKPEKPLLLNQERRNTMMERPIS